MNMTIEDTDDKVRSPTEIITNDRRIAHSANGIESERHIATSHILRRLKLSKSYRRRLNIMTRRKTGNLHKENANLFVKKVAMEANKLQAEWNVVT